MYTIPNMMSLFRIICAPFLVLSGLSDTPTIFFLLFGAMMITDALDGFVARALNQTSELGAKLDSYGDYSTYIAVGIGAALQWPEMFQRELYPILLSLFFFLLPAVISLIKFGHFVSYHTAIIKITAITMSIGIFLMLMFEEPLIFYVGIIVLFIEACENIAITLTLDKPRSDISSYWELTNE